MIQHWLKFERTASTVRARICGPRTCAQCRRSFAHSAHTERVTMEGSLELTYLLTARCRVLLEQLTGLQLVKKFPCISRNPKVHYRSPPPVSILGQPNPVHIPTSHLLEIHPNIYHPSTPRSPQWSPSLRFPHQDPIHSQVSGTCLYPGPVQSSPYTHIQPPGDPS